MWCISPQWCLNTMNRQHTFIGHVCSNEWIGISMPAITPSETQCLKRCLMRQQSSEKRRSQHWPREHRTAGDGCYPEYLIDLLHRNQLNSDNPLQRREQRVLLGPRHPGAARGRRFGARQNNRCQPKTSSALYCHLWKLAKKEKTKEESNREASRRDKAVLRLWHALWGGLPHAK